MALHKMLGLLTPFFNSCVQVFVGLEVAVMRAGFCRLDILQECTRNRYESDYYKVVPSLINIDSSKK